MSVNGIGGGGIGGAGGSGPPRGPSGHGKIPESPSDRTFASEVGDKSDSPPLDPSSTSAEPGVRAAQEASPAAATTGDLERLEAGHIDLDQYLDARVDEATAHLAGKVEPANLDWIREQLRERLAADPVLVRLVQRTTGVQPGAE